MFAGETVELEAFRQNMAMTLQQMRAGLVDVVKTFKARGDHAVFCEKTPTTPNVVSCHDLTAFWVFALNSAGVFQTAMAWSSSTRRTVTCCLMTFTRTGMVRTYMRQPMPACIIPRPGADVRCAHAPRLRGDGCTLRGI